MLALSLGCKNDIDINAPYKDVAIVYGFLDQNQATQYIRIEKLYQNSSTTSTAEGAKFADSLYFDSLVVKLINITSKDTFLCHRVDSIPKDSGFFSSAINAFYACTFPKNNAANEVFQLDIYYPKKKAHFYSKTQLVKDAVIEPRKIVMKLVPTNHTFPFRFTTGRNGYLYDLSVKYTYKEMNAADQSKYTFKSIDYNIVKSNAYDPEKFYTHSISSRQYIDYLKSQIPEDNSKVRTTVSITYQTYGGSQEFQTMLDLSKPNLTVVQKNPLFSNIEPAQYGIGIFTSRNFTERDMEIDPNTIILLGQELPNFID